MQEGARPAAEAAAEQAERENILLSKGQGRSVWRQRVPLLQQFNVYVLREKWVGSRRQWQWQWRWGV